MKAKTFSYDGRCPICGKNFKSDECPHSVGEAEKRVRQSNEDVRIKKMIDIAIKKALEERGL